MNIYVHTRDERLYHRLSLLPEGYTLTDVHHAALVIWDADSVQNPVTSLPILCITRDEKKASGCQELLLRPFSAQALEKKLSALTGLRHFPVLSPIEQKLFSLLIEAGEAGADRETLLHAIWGEKADPGLLTVYICYLRKKLEHDGKKRIFSLRGKGYKYCADDLNG